MQFQNSYFVFLKSKYWIYQYISIYGYFFYHIYFNYTYKIILTCVFLLILSFFEVFQAFPSILNNFRLTNIYVKISTDISDISVKSKYRYIHVYWYFKQWVLLNNGKTYITPIYGTKKLTIYESSPLIFYKRIFYLMTMIDGQSILVNVALNQYRY